jgi:hypothetical protein
MTNTKKLNVLNPKKLPIEQFSPFSNHQYRTNSKLLAENIYEKIMDITWVLAGPYVEKQNKLNDNH